MYYVSGNSLVELLYISQVASLEIGEDGFCILNAREPGKCKGFPH